MNNERRQDKNRLHGAYFLTQQRYCEPYTVHATVACSQLAHGEEMLLI